MEFKHKNHLLSGYLLLQKHIQEIRDIIQEGRPPTSDIANLSPLPENIQNELMEHLAKVKALYEELTQMYVAPELEKAKKREPVSATKMWAYIQLKQLEENMSTMHPKVFERRYGAMKSDERGHLKEIIEKILQELKEAQKLV